MTVAALPADAGRSKSASYVSLFWALLVRDTKGRYRRSSLGLAWAVLQPVLLLAMFVLLRGILHLPSDGVPFPMFAISGLIAWQFFVNSVTRGGPSVIGNGGIIKKVRLPLEIFPLVAVATSLIDLGVSSLVAGGMLAWYRIPVGFNLLWLPLLFVLIGAIGYACGLIVAAVGTFRQDVLLAIPFLMQIGMLASPLLYPVSRVPERWHIVYRLNPMVGLIEAVRGAMIHDRAPDPSALLVSVVVGAVLLAVGLPMFRRSSRYFADIL